jgi:exo-beta-1,3-glucanase (GH17 family)
VIDLQKSCTEKKILEDKLMGTGQLGINRFLLVTFLFIVMLCGCSKSDVASDTTFSISHPAVAYSPRGYEPGSSELSRKQIIEDLQLLKNLGFRSLVTYGAQGVLSSIPEIARNEGFDGTIIMGIWNPQSQEEITNALKQARFVNGYCVGNEGLGVRYSPDTLTSVMVSLRRITNHPVTTSERIDSYLYGPYQDWLLKNSDWLFPIAHPFWANQDDPIQAVNWLLARHDLLAATTGRRVILKEVGVPGSGKEGYNEDIQVQFFKYISSKRLSFFHFEAFDQPWKVSSQKLGLKGEAHWGLYRANGIPKKVARWLAIRLRNPRF